MTASPTRAGHAYLVWANWDHTYQLPLTGALRFARTTDHGSHWSAPVLIHQPSATSIDFSGHIVVLGDGTLLTVWANFDLAQGLGTLMASRSRDEGRTWQPAVEIGSQPVGMFTDPETGQELPQPGFPSVAISPDGTVYVASESSTSPSIRRRVRVLVTRRRAHVEHPEAARRSAPSRSSPRSPSTPTEGWA